MITRLNQLSIACFVDLACGDLNVLLDGKEKADHESLRMHARNLLADYRMIVDESGMKSLILSHEEILREKAAIVMYQSCVRMLEMGAYDEVREILRDHVRNVSAMTDEQMAKEVENALRSAIFEQKRNDEFRKNEKSPESADMRKFFDMEVAFIMTYFKMSINTRETNAAVYANMVRQANNELKARRRAMGK